jgi:hypothetical protein
MGYEDLAMNGAPNVVAKAPQTRLELATALAADGFWILPLVPGDSKAAAIPFKDGIGMSRDPAQLHEWFGVGNYDVAIATRKYRENECLVVVDEDNRDDKNGAAALVCLELQGLELPDTKVHSTLNKGRHHIYRHSQPPGHGGANKVAPGVDLKAGNSYIAASLAGRLYQCPGGPVAQAPAWLVDKCGRNHDVTRTRPAPTTTSDSARKRGRSYLASDAPVAVKGAGGNSTAYKVYCRLRDFGYAKADAQEDMAAIYNPRCPPGFRAELLDEIGNHAFTYAREDASCADPQQEFSVWIHDGPESYSALLQRDPAPVQELVPGLIERGICTFIDGPGGTHKSRVAMQLGLSIDAGAAVWGRPTEKARFVHLSSEDDINEIIRRAHAITRRLNLPNNPGAAFWDRKDKDSALARVKEGGEIELLPFHKALTEYLRSIQGHKFIVVDSLYDYIRYVGGARIDEDSVNAFIKRTLGALCTETDSTMLVIRHPSRAGIERGDMSSYSVANENAPRARLSLRAGDGDSYILKVEKRNHGVKGEEIVLHWSDGAMLPMDQMQETEQESKLSAAVVAVAIEAAIDDRNPMTMQANPTARQLKRIAELIGRRPASKEIKEELSHACRAGGPLAYVFADGKHRAGYFPTGEAEFLSRQLKKGGANPGANRVQTAGAD